MSTYVGYVCKSHTPNLPSEHWFNHGEEELTDAYRMVRAGTWPHDLDDQPLPILRGGGHATAQPIYWLKQHPHCTIALQDEYGKETPLEPALCTECRKCVGETALRTARETGNWWDALSVRMVVCPGCGDKRCPRASHHDNPCQHAPTLEPATP